MCVLHHENEQRERDNFPTLVDTQLAARQDDLNSIHMRTVSFSLSRNVSVNIDLFARSFFVQSVSFSPNQQLEPQKDVTR